MLLLCLATGTFYATARNASGEWWNGTTFETYNGANWGTYDFTATSVGDGWYLAADISGAVSYDLRLQAGGSPASTDTPMYTESVPSSSAPTAAEIRAEMDTNSTAFNTILTVFAEGTLVVNSVLFDVGGNLNGSILGGVNGTVGGVEGDMTGNLNGDIQGKVLGNGAGEFQGVGVRAVDGDDAALATAENQTAIKNKTDQLTFSVTNKVDSTPTHAALTSLAAMISANVFTAGALVNAPAGGLSVGQAAQLDKIEKLVQT